MIGSFLTRGLVMIFGYAYPAYECYKTVERNKPDIEQLRFWCQYWILVAFLTIFERICDTLVSWVPMYSEAKLAFYIYLWYPKTKGTSYVYNSFFRPYVAKHEMDIDRNLLELRTRAGDYAVLYWQRAFSYGQTRIFDVLQYIAAQSTPRPRAPQPQQQATRSRKPTAPLNKKPSAITPLPSEEPPSPPSSTSLSEEEEAEELPETSASQALKVTASVTGSSLLSSTSASFETSNQLSSNEAEKKPIEKASSSSVDELENPPVEEIVMEEAVRVTRGRLRKNRSISSAN